MQTFSQSVSPPPSYVLLYSRACLASPLACLPGLLYCLTSGTFYSHTHLTLVRRVCVFSLSVQAMSLLLHMTPLSLSLSQHDCDRGETTVPLTLLAFNRLDKIVSVKGPAVTWGSTPCAASRRRSCCKWTRARLIM